MKFEFRFPTFEELKTVAEQISNDYRGSVYSKTYPHFVKHFNKILQEFNEQDLIIGICLTYAWMPRQLRIYRYNFEACLAILNKVKKGEDIDRTEFETVVETFDNSAIAVSKLFHFVSPDFYPLFDRKVKSAIKAKGKFDYLMFREKCLQIVRDPQFDTIHQSLLGSLASNEFQHSRLRSLDIVLFNAESQLK